MSSEHAIDDRRQRQTSFYLVRRAEALRGALGFFDAPSATPQRMIRFLAQVDFWEWELDNLIYSFTNLAERQETWRSTKSAVNKLGQLGIALDAKLVSRVRWARGSWEAKADNARVAPVELLRDVLDVWNRLIDACERRFIAPMREKADKWNIQTRRDLNSFRRTMPAELAAFEVDDADESGED